MPDFIQPDGHTDTTADRMYLTATPNGVAVRTTEAGGVHMLTADQADALAERVAGMVWAGVLCGGGAVLSARPLERCVVVTVGGYASAAELEAFAALLTAAAEKARRYAPPDTAARRQGRRGAAKAIKWRELQRKGA